MKPTCGVALAAVCASAVRAGIIASSSGRPSVAPSPRRTVRRVRCFLVTNMSVAPYLAFTATVPSALPAAGSDRSTMLDRNAGAFTMPITMDENL